MRRLVLLAVVPLLWSAACGSSEGSTTAGTQPANLTVCQARGSLAQGLQLARGGVATKNADTTKAGLDAAAKAADELTASLGSLTAAQQQQVKPSVDAATAAVKAVPAPGGDQAAYLAAAHRAGDALNTAIAEVGTVAGCQPIPGYDTTAPR